MHDRSRITHSSNVSFEDPVIREVELYGWLLSCLTSIVGGL